MDIDYIFRKNDTALFRAVFTASSHIYDFLKGFLLIYWYFLTYKEIIETDKYSKTVFWSRLNEEWEDMNEDF